MKINLNDYKIFSTHAAGYCSKCDHLTALDIRKGPTGFKCPDCGHLSVMSIDTAIQKDLVKIDPAAPNVEFLPPDQIPEMPISH